jgi:hypothetical protein
MQRAIFKRAGFDVRFPTIIDHLLRAKMSESFYQQIVRLKTLPRDGRDDRRVIKPQPADEFDEKNIPEPTSTEGIAAVPEDRWQLALFGSHLDDAVNNQDQNPAADKYVRHCWHGLNLTTCAAVANI